MGFREDDPLYYKMQMQRLLNKARKNGIQVNYGLWETPAEKHLKVLFKDPGSGECAGVTVVKRGK